MDGSGGRDLRSSPRWHELSDAIGWWKEGRPFVSNDTFEGTRRLQPSAAGSFEHEGPTVCHGSERCGWTLSAWC